MKLIWTVSALLAIALAKEIEIEPKDLEAAESVKILRSDQETLETSPSTYASYTYAGNYIPPSQRPPRPWNPPQNNYVPPQNNYVPPQNSYVPPINNNYPPQNDVPQQTYIPPVNNYIPPQNNYVPPVNNLIPPNNNYVPPFNNPVPPQNNYVPPANNLLPPQNNYIPPSNNIIPPQNNYVPPVNNIVPPQNNYVPPQNNYIPPVNNYFPPPPSNDYIPPATTSVPILINEQNIGENGNYNYEYKIGDGTHVREEGYLTNPNTPNESIVKKGFYSYVGADGRTYTVTYWADDTGFHATGDHLPTPPPVPAAIQAALDQKAEAEKNQAQQGYPPTQAPTYYPPQPQQPGGYYPPQTQQPTYYPQNQQTYYPPSYGK